MAAPTQSSPNQANETKQESAKENAIVAEASSKDMPAESTTVASPSPSLKDPPPSEQSSDSNLKDPPPPSTPGATGAPSASQTEKPRDLTYDGSKTSDAYVLAKGLLAEGDFERAMALIGQVMTETISRIGQDQADLHESMAPFYYLYGTTLLYQVEELEQMTAAQGEDSDLAIAGENLEAARVILTKMLEGKPEDKEIKLDLAQVYCRLGDMLRTEMEIYDQASAQYHLCLEIRQPLLGLYDRKVAEIHNLLGITYESLAKEQAKQVGTAAPQAAQQNQQQPTVSPAEKCREFSNMALTHYLTCGKSFAGQIAFICGADPEVITADPDPNENVVGGGGGAKTTGMTKEELKLNEMSHTMKTIRARVAKLQIPEGASESAEQVAEWKEILDEIQESIDNAEKTTSALGEVTEMSAQAQAAAKGEGGAEVANADGSTTTIGFGGSAATSAAGRCDNPWANLPSSKSASAGPAEAAKPVMMVVRKKKRTNPDTSEGKMPAEEDSKRPKTE